MLIKGNVKRHTADEIEKIDQYIKEFYRVMTARNIADKLGEKVSYIQSRATKLGLKKEVDRSVYAKRKGKFERKKKNPNPITYSTKVILCSAILRGESLVQVAKDTNRPENQMEKLLEECKLDGTFDRIKEYQNEDWMITYASDHSAYRKCRYTM